MTDLLDRFPLSSATPPRRCSRWPSPSCPPTTRTITMHGSARAWRGPGAFSACHIAGPNRRSDVCHDSLRTLQLLSTSAGPPANRRA